MVGDDQVDRRLAGQRVLVWLVIASRVNHLDLREGRL